MGEWHEHPRIANYWHEPLLYGLYDKPNKPPSRIWCGICGKVLYRPIDKFRQALSEEVK